MIPELAALSAVQGGCITRRQALDAGYTERQLKTALRSGGGEWVTIRRGVYAERWVWESADEVGRHRMRVHAAALLGHAPYVISHSSAAVLHDIDCRPHQRELVHVSHPRVLGGRTEGGVKHHPAHVPDDQVQTIGSLQATGLARTAVDVAREHGIEDGVVAMDQVRRRGVSVAELEEVIRQMRSWPYVTWPRAAVDLSDPGAANLGETLGRLLVVQLGFGRPRTQVEISDGARRAYVDMLLEDHVFEFDGRRKFVGRSRGGFAPADVEQALWEEKQREDWLRSLGYGVSRIIWADLFGVRRREALRRLEREFLATRARRGPQRAS